MAILNIDKLLTNLPRNRVATVGIEMEGGWCKIPVCQTMNDASVGKAVPLVAPAGQIFVFKGEALSGKMMPKKIPIWVKKNFPDAVNETCGLHMHMGFQGETPEAEISKYNLLTSPDYQDTMIEYLSRWAKEENIPASHCIWPRLAGLSIFCQFKHWPSEQIEMHKKEYDKERKGHRYTAICYPYARHGTIECRILPMFDTPEQCIRALWRVLAITNACLIVLARKLKVPAVTARIELDSEAYEETIREVIPIRQPRKVVYG